MLRSGVNRSQAQVATHIRTNQQSFSRHQVFSEKLDMRGVAFAEARCDFQVITPEETPKWSALCETRSMVIVIRFRLASGGLRPFWRRSIRPRSSTLPQFIRRRGRALSQAKTEGHEAALIAGR